MDVTALLRQVADGRIPVDEAVQRLESDQEVDLGFARLDLSRLHRCGVPEVVFGEGKTPGQVIEIVQALHAHGQRVLVTRAAPEISASLSDLFPDAVYHEQARCVTLPAGKHPPRVGRVGVVTAGTSDVPVAEEACVAAEHLGANVERIYDVGVAGLHRLLSRMDEIRLCRVLIVVAGMEGALPSVVGGLTDRPLIAVPTSIGYGMNLDGLSALLSMLNTCVAGITVVNIDNGFGAGVAAAMINRMGEQE